MLMAEEKVEVHNVLSFKASSSFLTEVKAISIDSNGVEKILEGCHPRKLSVLEVEAYVQVICNKLIKESLGLVGSKKSKQIREIIFGLESYIFQVYAFEKSGHRIVTLGVFKLSDKKKKKHDELLFVLGEGSAFFRAQIEFNQDELVDVRLILNQPF